MKLPWFPQYFSAQKICFPFQLPCLHLFLGRVQVLGQRHCCPGLVQADLLLRSLGGCVLSHVYKGGFESLGRKEVSGSLLERRLRVPKECWESCMEEAQVRTEKLGL